MLTRCAWGFKGNKRNVRFKELKDCVIISKLEKQTNIELKKLNGKKMEKAVACYSTSI